MTDHRIDEYWDPDGEITATSDASAEYENWKEFASRSDNDWAGDEYELTDFEDYIENLD